MYGPDAICNRFAVDVWGNCSVGNTLAFGSRLRMLARSVTPNSQNSDDSSNRRSRISCSTDMATLIQAEQSVQAAQQVGAEKVVPQQCWILS